MTMAILSICGVVAIGAAWLVANGFIRSQLRPILFGVVGLLAAAFAALATLMPARL